MSRDGKNIPNYVQNEGGARFRVNFLPDKPCVHYVRIKLNGIHIHGRANGARVRLRHLDPLGSPFVCNVFSTELSFENHEYAPVNKRAALLIKPKSPTMFNPNIHVEVITPAGKKLKGKVDKLSASSYSVGFVPSEIGDHEIRFYHDEDKKLIMTKLNCQVYDISKLRVSDLLPAVAHQPYKFTSKIAFSTARACAACDDDYLAFFSHL